MFHSTNKFLTLARSGTAVYKIPTTKDVLRTSASNDFTNVARKLPREEDGSEDSFAARPPAEDDPGMTSRLMTRHIRFCNVRMDLICRKSRSPLPVSTRARSFARARQRFAEISRGGEGEGGRWSNVRSSLRISGIARASAHAISGLRAERVRGRRGFVCQSQRMDGLRIES